MYNIIKCIVIEIQHKYWDSLIHVIHYSIENRFENQINNSFLSIAVISHNLFLTKWIIIKDKKNSYWKLKKKIVIRMSDMKWDSSNSKINQTLV